MSVKFELSCNESKYISENIVIHSNYPLDLRPDSITLNNFSINTFDNGVYSEVPIKKVTTHTKYVELETDDLIEDKNYLISIFAIPVSATDIYAYDYHEPIEATVLKFLSIADLNSTKANSNNVYSNFKDIENILHTEHLFKHKNDFTLKFNPTNYNFDFMKYEVSDEVVTIENDEAVLNNLISQYFTEYKTFYDVINTATAKNPSYDNEYIHNLHLIFMNNIAKWYALKGNKTYIELMFTLYVKYLGFNILSMIEDGVNNFTYRISSSLPKKYWDNLIKPYVHPVSWNSIYSEITSNTDAIYYQLYDARKMVKESWVYDCVSYLDADHYTKTTNAHYIRMKQIYHSSGNIEPYNLAPVSIAYLNAHTTFLKRGDIVYSTPVTAGFDTVSKVNNGSTPLIVVSDKIAVGKIVYARTHTLHQHGIHKNECTFVNLRDESKFNINLNVFKSPIDYQQRGLFKELKDLKNIEFTINRFNKTITLDFGLPGVANEYIYETTNEDYITSITQSLLSKVTIPYDEKDIIVLKLKKNEWVQSVYKVAPQNPFNNYKALYFDNAYHSVDTKYINIGLDRNAYRYNGIAVRNFTSEKTNTNISVANEFGYMFSDPLSASGFVAEFDTGVTFKIIPVTETYNGITFKRTKFVYPKTGIANKYQWDLYINNTLVENKVTYHNNVYFNIKASDYLQAKAKLTIFYKNGSYSLNNEAICV